MTRATTGAVLAALAVGVITGAMLDAWLQPGPVEKSLAPSATRPDDPRTTDAQIRALNAALDEERKRREALELELAFLQQESESEAAETPGTSVAAYAEPAPKANDEAAEPTPPEPARKDWFDVPALRRRGIDERRAEWLRERFEALQMEELYLRDRAARDGWLNEPRHYRQLQRLRNTARKELGISDYDWMLFASRRNNRVMVTNVLRDSPATAAGIEPGDLILRYGEVAVLTPRELLAATTRGEPGSSVAVEIQRDGDVQRLYLSRGPLGARITAVRRPPLFVR